MRVLLVGNPASGGGRGRNQARRAEIALTAAGARVTTALTGGVGDARRMLSPPPSDVDRVVACGGDGLISEIAGALRGGDLPLAILPAGRGNDLARALRLPIDVAAAARHAVEGRVRRIDLGLAAGRSFCTVAACGLDAEVSRRARSSRAPLPGAAVYVWELLRALRTFRGAHVRIEHSGGVIEDELLLLAVANTAGYGGGFLIAPSADPADGLLDVCLVRRSTRLAALTLFPAVYRGRHERLARVRTLRTEELTVSTSPPLAVEADGESIGATPLTYRVDRAALPIVEPRD